tara:strand:+ start:624 stop:839 length:216 start_codon:yes stop_codon:yes gene_type:complete
MIREKIHKTGMTSTTECLVLYNSFPSRTKKVIKDMMTEGYNISIINDMIDMTYIWLDCKNNVVFPQKRTLN